MDIRWIAIAAALPLAACASMDAPAEPGRTPPPTEAACNADAVQSLVGQTATPDLGAQLLKGSGATDAALGPAAHRRDDGFPPRPTDRLLRRRAQDRPDQLWLMPGGPRVARCGSRNKGRHDNRDESMTDQFDLTDDQRQIQEMARKFTADAITPHRRRMGREAHLPARHDPRRRPSSASASIYVSRGERAGSGSAGSKRR